MGGILVFAEDITHRKQMEEALSGMTRKLIESQEQERSRIGRELHDDVNQKLAMLAIELQGLQANPSDIQSRIEELRRRTTEISDDVQALSHELHSSKLDYRGVAGIRSWCGEFAQRHKLTSMRERVRLVNGTIRINSKPNRGTSIQVGVPFPPEQDSARVVG